MIIALQYIEIRVPFQFFRFNVRVHSLGRRATRRCDKGRMDKRTLQVYPAV